MNMKNYAEILHDLARKQGDKTLLRIDGETTSYRELDRRVHELAAGFPQDLCGRILVMAEGPADQLTAFLALQQHGALPILCHHGLASAEMEAILRENGLQGKLTLDGTGGFRYEPTGLAERPHAEPDIMGVLTSGSTGVPKALYRTLASWRDFFPVQNQIFGINKESCLFLHGSLSFTGNLNALLSLLCAGGSLVTSRLARSRKWLQNIREAQADVIYLVPAKLRLLGEAADGPLPGVKHIFTGSQLLTGRALARLQQAFPKAEIALYYGASELNYITYRICDSENYAPDNLGKPFPGVKLEIRHGLIYVDSPYHVSGVKTPCSVQDVGSLNEQGELIFAGRKGGWINKGGVKISSAKVEQELKDIPGIRDAAVLGYNDRARGSELAAFLVAEEGAAQLEIRQALRHALSPVEMPSKIYFLKALPLNDRGKVSAGELWQAVRQSP